jgi:N-acyl homoserine lactone hydrolase
MSISAVSRTERGSGGPVKAVSVISTGTVQIRPEHPYGSRKPLYWWLLTSRQWTPPRPVNVYVIEHAQGLLLFDTGQDRASVTDDTYFPGGLTGFGYGRLARFAIGEQDTLTAQLATLGYAPGDVDTVILSHLHQDHIGGLAELTGADLLVSAAEWAELSRPGPELRGFLRRRIQLPGLRWHQVSPGPAGDPSLAPFTESLDVMGDGSLMLLPTPGHTPPRPIETRNRCGNTVPGAVDRPLPGLMAPDASPVQRVTDLRVRHPLHAWSDDVACDVNLAFGEVDRPWSPDLERVYPCVAGVGSRQGRVLAEVAASGSPLRGGQAWIDTGLRYCLTAVCAGSAAVRAALCAGATHFGAPEGQCGVVAPFPVPALGPMATGRRSILLHACGRSATGTATPAG